MKVDIKDLKVWPMLNYLPHSLLKTVRLVYVLGTDVLLVTHDNELLVYGSNSQRGLCQNRDKKAAKQVFYDVNNLVKIEELSDKPIKGIVCNAHDATLDKKMFVVICLENGEVYFWGFNPNRVVITFDNFTKPILVEGISKKVVKVACGENHFLALTESGQVFAWGDNSYGQIGLYLGVAMNKAMRVGKKIFLERIADIACGSFFSIAVTQHSGKVYSWGQNDHGQLGLNLESKATESSLPRIVTHLQDVNIQSIACGSNHVLALNEFGELYSWGCNLAGQLGLGSTEAKSKRYPQKWSSAKRFKKIAASGDLSVGEIISGKIYVWGKTCGEETPSPVLCPCSTINEVFALFKGRMNKPVTITSPVDSISETLAYSFGKPENSDFKIIAEEKEIYVHKTVLTLRSEYFRRMFQEQWSEGRTSSVEMNENFEALSAYLKYLYTDILDLSHPEVALDVSVIADKYCEPNLVDLCLQKFERSLNKTNVAALYELTLERKLENFTYACVNFAFHHLSDIVETAGFENWNSSSYKSFFSHYKIKWALEK